MRRIVVTFALAAASLLVGCQTPAEHAEAVRQAQGAGDKMTVGNPAN